MITQPNVALRRAADRGHTKLGWLDSHHTFSFGGYQDRAHMGFGPLRVINDDRVAAGGGFGEHGHSDMEIITYVLEGGLAHSDSLGNGSVINPGDVQRMSAGRGIRHAEYNASKSDPVHFLQIWIEPDRRGLQPSYEQKSFPDLEGEFHLIAARDGRNGAVTIHQDANIHLARLNAGERAAHDIRPGRNAWLHVASGAVTLDGLELSAGDGAAITSAGHLDILAKGRSEILLFDFG